MPVPRISRRRFLATAAAGAAGGGLLTMLEARHAPGEIKGTTLRVLYSRHVVPAYDTWFAEFARRWGDRNGVTVTIDHVAHPELPARYAAEAAAGAGHDLIHFSGQVLTGQYHRHLVDVSDVADALARRHGGWIDNVKSAAHVGGRWYGVPDFFVAFPMLWRRDLFASVGLTHPGTWHDFRHAARLLRPKGHPTGMPFSHCSDANHGWRTLMYCFGARETDPSGEQVEIDSQETREALKFAKALFDEGMTPDVFSWDDASDDHAFGSGVACWVHDALAAWRATENADPNVFEQTLVLPAAAGPVARLTTGEPALWAIWKFASNTAAAKEFIEHVGDHQEQAIVASRGVNMPMLLDYYRKPMPMFGNNPKLFRLQDQHRITVFFGYPGPMTPAAQDVLAAFIIPEMFTRVARGVPVDDAMKWAVAEIRRIYAKHRTG